MRKIEHIMGKLTTVQLLGNSHDHKISSVILHCNQTLAEKYCDMKCLVLENNEHSKL